MLRDVVDYGHMQCLFIDIQENAAQATAVDFKICHRNNPGWIICDRFKLGLELLKAWRTHERLEQRGLRRIIFNEFRHVDSIQDKVQSNTGTIKKIRQVKPPCLGENVMEQEKSQRIFHERAVRIKDVGFFPFEETLTVCVCARTGCKHDMELQGWGSVGRGGK